jgi:hypothetical protein
MLGQHKKLAARALDVGLTGHDAETGRVGVGERVRTREVNPECQRKVKTW